jgi:hypothetical protein
VILLIGDEAKKRKTGTKGHARAFFKRKNVPASASFGKSFSAASQFCSSVLVFRSDIICAERKNVIH